jgi:hypothetical protein
MHLLDTPAGRRPAPPPLSRERAHDVAIAFGQETGHAATLRPRSRGGFDAIIPVEWLAELLAGSAFLPAVETPES